MNRIFCSFSLPQMIDTYGQIIRSASNRYNHMAFLSSSGINHDPYTKADAMLAAGVYKHILPEEESFNQLEAFVRRNNDWMFGFLSYDLKNEVENLVSENPDGIKMPMMHFFIPEVLVFFKGNRVEVGLTEGYQKSHLQVLDELLEPAKVYCSKSTVKIQHRVSEEEYINQVNHIRNHIRRGDIYEMNYCIEFFAEEAEIDPVESFLFLNKNNPAPFACFYRFDDRYLISSSPERFMAKRGSTIISQPIKGTIRRGKSPEEDELLREQLYNDPKERSENIMIVDLVRNDLSKTARDGSVKVKELCGIYSYTYVHQMISTIEAELDEEFHFTEAIRECFPMGSMTGAPKVRAMQLIEEAEKTRRGLYSGAVGYITPEGDFDFNVIIRSILYNSSSRYLSFMAGSAITVSSDPLKEYHECLLKATSMAKTIEENSSFQHQ